MEWTYYLATVLIILACASFCVVLLVKYRKIRREGVLVSCEILDNLAGFPARMRKEFIMEVSYEYEGLTYTGSCAMKRFGYFAPNVGESIELVLLPGKAHKLYPTKLTKYPVFSTAVLMAVVALLFTGGLIASIVTILST
ncbi:MAG: hypothetical protein FWG48_00435 [Oscillospiraceae bacterium]|nr:hypothetical protein [Oscillospiraceae bacterium]